MRRRLVPAVVAAVAALAGCGGSGSESAEARAGERLEVVVGVYPYEFVAERVGGPDVEVRNLTSPGAEPHDLELTPQQAVAIGAADLVVYAPGLQPAVDDAVRDAAAAAELDVSTVVAPRRVQPGDDDHGGHQGAGQHDGGHSDGDPHLWLDPTGLASVAGAVGERLAELDPDRAGAFRDRAAELQLDLATLDGELRAGLSSCARRTLVTSHAAFGHLADRYGLEQVGVSGLSPEGEPSPARLAEVARMARERGATTVFFDERTGSDVADTLAGEIGAGIAPLSALEGPPEDGDYLTAMRANLQALRAALDCA